ncbi:hypothetical protein L873DRAFT_1808575 [Choiromyces venosus 120613-1]|uniref:Uncharacterized protein n=1 Tax=Choiromyces venosus 120613-1 TaxID=1336337 RepID=A0A3N4JX63_9PEZI|nr:hypothetical protein L873DRAFT_1808575 [Choiromyces venosus 120613-1]
MMTKKESAILHGFHLFSIFSSTLWYILSALSPIVGSSSEKSNFIPGAFKLIILIDIITLFLIKTISSWWRLS